MRQRFFWFIHSWIWYFIKTFLPGDIFLLGGFSSFLKSINCRNRNSKKLWYFFDGHKRTIFWVHMLGKWWGNISKSQISYVIFSHISLGNITSTNTWGVYKYQKFIQSHSKKLTFYFFYLFCEIMVGRRNNKVYFL